jgi:hypothetical protein
MELNKRRKSMRTMKKSGVFAALTVALLVMVVLVTQGCFVPDTESDTIDIGKITGLERTGTVRLNFGYNTGARTIMPDELEMADFLSYRVIYTPSPSGVGATTTNIAASAIGAPITLPVGAYTLQVIAYKATGQGTPVAVANMDTICLDKSFKSGGAPVTSITITDSPTPTTVYVTLKPYGVVTGQNGTFTWDIKNSLGTDVFTYDIKVSTFKDSGTFQEETGLDKEDLTGSFGFSAPLLSSGFKWVDVTLHGPTGDTFKFRDLAHVYQNMNTTFTYEFLPTFVTIPSSGQGSITIDYDQGGDVTFTFTLDPGSESAIDTVTGGGKVHTDPVKMSLSDTVYPKEIIITMSASGVTLSGQEWFADDGDDEVGTGLTLTINLDDGDVFDTKGLHEIILIAYVGGLPYSITNSPIIYIEVVD